MFHPIPENLIHQQQKNHIVTEPHKHQKEHQTRKQNNMDAEKNTQKTHSHFSEIQYADSSSITYFKMPNYLDVPSLGNDHSSPYFIPDIKDKLDLLSPAATFAKNTRLFSLHGNEKREPQPSCETGTNRSCSARETILKVQLMVAMSKSYKARDETDTLNNQILTEKKTNFKTFGSELCTVFPFDLTVFTSTKSTLIHACAPLSWYNSLLGVSFKMFVCSVNETTGKGL